MKNKIFLTYRQQGFEFETLKKNMETIEKIVNLSPRFENSNLRTISLMNPKDKKEEYWVEVSEYWNGKWILNGYLKFDSVNECKSVDELTKLYNKEIK